MSLVDFGGSARVFRKLKGTWSKNYCLGTKEQKGNKAGNTGTKAVFLVVWGTRERNENFVGNKGT